MIELTYQKWSQSHPQVLAAEDWNPLVDAVNAISGVHVNATFITDANETVSLPSALRHRNLSGAGDAQLHVPRRHQALHLVGANDALQVGVPSDIGVANAEGVQADFVRRDHTHNHPAGLGVDLHHPQIHAPTHSGGGTDPINIGAGQVTSGVFDLARLPTYAMRKRYGCIVWLYSGFYEATDLGTGRLVYGGAGNAGGVNGGDVNAVCDAVVDTAGYQYLFIASQGTPITWLRDNIPANTIIEGDLPQYVIIREETNPDINYVTISHESMLKNLSVWDRGGVDIGLPINAPRPVNFHVNNRETTTVNVSSWFNQFCVVDTGESGVDRPGIGVNLWGHGDAYWAGVRACGVGLNVNLNQGNPAMAGTGVAVTSYASGHSFFAVSKSGATGVLYQATPETDVTSFQSTPIVPTANDIVISSVAKTSGTMVNLWHHSSAMTGNGLLMNFANGSGTFTGHFISLSISGVEHVYVNYDGTVEVLPQSDTVSFESTPTVDTTTDIAVVHTSKTSGQMISLYHDMSNFAGNGITMNFAATSGAFTGHFINCLRDGNERFKVDDTGQVWLTRSGVGDFLGFRIDGDTNDRFTMTDTSLAWGTGGSGVDTNLYRNAANVLKTDDTFEANVVNSINHYEVNGTQVVGTQGAAIANAGVVGGGGADSDDVARGGVDANAATINLILARLRAHGLIDT